MRADPRWDDALSFLKSVPKGGTIAELGVWRGVFARMTFDTLKPKHMYLVDWWAPYSNSGGGQELWDKVCGQAKAKFGKELKAKRVEVIRDNFVTAAIQVPNEHLDFIRHDGDEREAQVKAVLNAWWRTLKVGGIWMAHGWTVDPWHGVPNAILEFARRYSDVRIEGILADCSHVALRKTA